MARATFNTLFLFSLWSLLSHENRTDLTATRALTPCCTDTTISLNLHHTTKDNRQRTSRCKAVCVTAGTQASTALHAAPLARTRNHAMLLLLARLHPTPCTERDSPFALSRIRLRASFGVDAEEDVDRHNVYSILHGVCACVAACLHLYAWVCLCCCVMCGRAVAAVVAPVRSGQRRRSNGDHTCGRMQRSLQRLEAQHVAHARREITHRSLRAAPAAIDAFAVAAADALLSWPGLLIRLTALTSTSLTSLTSLT